MYNGNWIAELSKLKTAIPKEWLEKNRKRESIMTKVKTQLSLINTNFDFNMVTDKDIYRTLIRNQVTQPYLLPFLENKLGKQETNRKCIYKQINNRLKQFRSKLINNIINTNVNLFRWKILPSPLCLSCYTYCDLEHFFISCPLFNEL